MRLGSRRNGIYNRTLPDFTELHGGDLTGQTLAPGLYKWAPDRARLV